MIWTFLTKSEYCDQRVCVLVGEGFVIVLWNHTTRLLHGRCSYAGFKWVVVISFSLNTCTDGNNTNINTRRRQHVVVEGRSSTPLWPRMVGLLHTSAGGVSLLSPQSWSISRLFGRPGRRFQLCWGGWPRVRSTWHLSTWCAGVLILVTIKL